MESTDTTKIKQLLLIGGLTDSSVDQQSLTQLYAYFKETLPDFNISATYLDKIAFAISPEEFTAFDTQNNRDLGSFDMIYIRGPRIRLNSPYAYYVSRYAAANEIVCVNDYSIYYPGTKISQTIVFREQRAPFLKTIYCADNQIMVETAGEQLSYPFILKTNVGSHGDSNYLVTSQEDAQQRLANEPEVDFLAQEFCPNNRDYRLLLCNGESLLFERKGDGVSHINNTSKGAAATQADLAILPAEIVAKARTVADCLGLMVSGVDVMPHLDTNDYYFLEINTQPQLRTGALLEEKRMLVQHLFQQLGN